MSKHIYVEKLAEVKGGLPARSMNEHDSKDFVRTNTSIPIEYNIEGYLLHDDIVVGHSVFIDRTKRNGEEVSGMLATSRVTEVGDNYFKTQNSVYSYKFL